MNMNYENVISFLGIILYLIIFDMKYLNYYLITMCIKKIVRIQLPSKEKSYMRNFTYLKMLVCKLSL